MTRAAVAGQFDELTWKAPCILTLQPPKVVVKYGDKASANCSTNTDHIGMGWEASQGPVDMKDDVQLITWSVDSLVDWGMKPFCFMNPNPDQQCKVHLNVTIYKTPESVSISTVNHTGPMIEGGQYELQCDIQNVAPAELLTVSWFKGDTLVNKETFANSIKTPVNRSSTLQISPSRADDGGQYRCEAELDLGPEGPQPPPTVTSDHLNITVHYGPEIESGDESVEVYEGRDVTLPCTAEGNPEPEVKWSFNNQSKTTGGRQTTLTISGATPADGGEYTCTATNTFGSQTRRVFLVVKEIPDRVSISFVNHNGQMTEDEPYELQCDIQKVSLLESLTVNWFKEGTLVKSKTFTKPTKTPENVLDMLQITPSINDNGAHYRCEAKLDLGTDGPPLTVTSDALRITVQSPCILTLQPPKVVVKYGDKASANCSTTIDHIGMGWEASQGPVDMKDDVQLITWSVDSLVDWGMKPFCFMNPNPDQQCKVHLNVTIYKTPESVSISTVNHTGPMIEGGQYELQCDIQNVAPAEFLTVSWFKGDTLVNKETFANLIKTPVNRSSTLQISPSRADDGGQYRCEAELDLGPEGPQPPPTVTSDHLNITVHYGPEIESGDESVEVYEGRDVTLPCTAEGNPEPEVKWSFNNQSKTTGGRQTTLTISGATPADGGEYTCTATNTFGSQTRRVFLVVKEIPDRVSISFVNHNGQMTEDEPYELQCDIQKVSLLESLTVNWFKEGTLVKSKTFTKPTKTPENVLDMLQITPSINDNGAHYRCEAKLDLGTDGPPLTVTSDALRITVQSPCILTLQPPKVVVKYGDKASANCSTTTDHKGMGWEASQGPVDMKDDVQLITWSVDSLVDWGMKPFCFMNPNPDQQCKVHLNVTIYKTPESVSISTVNHTGPMIEGGQYELQCDIQNVAPAEFLTVSWFKGDTLVNKETFANLIKTPVNRSATLQISPSRADDGGQYRCEAELDLGPEGPQPPPTVTSDPLNIAVHCKSSTNCFIFFTHKQQTGDK
ncbi:intercellular adhesion molecule 5 isoform X2 [Pygocentrus nattereri]|uniref:intercellular adhesion molecule 5 isoform X2 n=1 Tax=Pygocentrus nattereri TaxID=42514 RepID=UPI001890C841|nr:intercellular adhesion molecule 5 isoform X2 [Pygocentrus nattereri]